MTGCKFDSMVDGNEPSDSAYPAEPPFTPNNLDWLRNGSQVNEALRRFGTESGIEFKLPTEKESPAKRNKSPIYEVQRLFSQLFFVRRDILERQVTTFLDWYPIYKSDEEKLKELQRLLSNGTEEHMKLLSSRATRAPQNITPQIDEGPLPQSPTLSAKHAPKMTVEEIDRMDEDHLQPLTRVTSNTSFAGVSANTSFWSEPQRGSNDAHSPATTVHGSFASVENFGPSGSESFQTKLAKAGVSTETLVDYPDVQLDGIRNSNTQETDYGSSWSQVTDMFPQPALPRAPSPSKEPVANGRDTSPERHGLEHHRVKNIANDVLSNISLPGAINQLPFALRCESLRFIQASKLDPTQFLEEWNSLNQQLGIAKTFGSLHRLADKLCSSFRRSSETAYDNHSLCAKLRWNESNRSNEGTLLKFELLPPQKLPLNALQRKFGSDRFLSVDVDPLSKPPEKFGLRGQRKHIQSRFLEMLAKEHEFLGRTWIQFHTQEKKRKKGGDLESDRVGLAQHIFVALKGDNLPVLKLRDTWSWMVHFGENANKLWSKVYSRSDLFVSRAERPISFSPEEIQRVPDIWAKEDVEEDRQFSDPRLQFDDKFIPKTVMDDGCSEAHEWVLRKIGEAYGTNIPPSAAQFRLGPAKGVIVMKRPDDNSEYDPQSRPPGVLIQINDSQQKLKMRENEEDSTLFDPHLHALNVVSISHPLKPSYLYFDFLYIMIDRHVPAKAIEDYAELQAKRDVADFLEAVRAGGESLRYWITRQHSAREELLRDTEIGTLAGFPKAKTERANQMLEAGFEPTVFAPLADLVRGIAGQFFNQQRKAYKISLARSTMALAVVDRHGILKPGEIQLNFSNRFEDPYSGKSWSHLSGPVLVARNPAARPSDMQKVKAVYYGELDHLYDVVVFSSLGRQPLADKLSGGDYDGDKMWICWEPSLVKDFLNAPAPRSLPDPTTFGIDVDDRTLGEIVSDLQSEEQVREFVEMGTANRMRMSLLGTVTKTLERLIYKDNSMSTKKARLLADLKDLIMDSDKNGRFLSEEAWNNLKSKHGIGPLPDPAYFPTVAADDETSREPVTPKREKKPKPENILDKVHCIILKTIIDGAVKELNQVLSKAEDRDEELSATYDQTFSQDGADPQIYRELASLRDKKLPELKKMWDQEMRLYHDEKNSIKKGQRWDDTVRSCRKIYESIQPDERNDPTMTVWLRVHGNWPTIWDLHKASALAKFYHGKGKMWVSIAGPELCLLKAQASQESKRTMLLSRYMDLRPRKRKRTVEVSEDHLDENGDVERLLNVDEDDEMNM